MFSKFFIHRPVFALVVSIFILIVGGITIPGLPIENTPNITPPTVEITAAYPGASAAVIADTVVAPIEEQVNGVEDMLYMSSKSADDGSATITVTFAVGTDIDMATVLVQNRVAKAMSLLPEEVKREGVITQKKSTSITLMVTLLSPDNRYDEIYLSNYGTTRIKDALARVDGVGEVSVMGARDFSMRVWLDPEQLAARDVTTVDVVSAIRQQNVQVAAGQIGAPPAPKGQDFQYTVRTLGRLTDVEQFKNIIIKRGEGGRLLRVRDVARVELASRDYNWFVQLNGAPSVALAVYQQPGANALAIAEAVQAEMDRLAESFPEGVHYTIPYNTTRFINASIREVVETLLVALLLVIFTVYVFLQDWRDTLIPTAAIPVSIIGTFAVMGMLGLSINTLTLFGLVLAIGIVVDDAIIVVENTKRLMDDEGLSSRDAAVKAMMEVTGPVVATTLVLLAVFVPTAMIAGITGRLYQQFAITIATATVFSSVSALTLSPALCGILLRPTPKQRRGIWRLYEIGFGWITNLYVGTVKIAVRRVVLCLLLVGGFFFLTGKVFTMIPGGFLPDEDQGYFFVQAQLPEGASLQRSTEVINRITKWAMETEGVADVVTIGGYSLLDSVMKPNAACCFVTLDPWDERSAPHLHLHAMVAAFQRRVMAVQEGFVLCFAPPPIDGLGNATGFDFQLQDRGDVGFNQLETFGNDLMIAGMQHPKLTRMYNGFRTDTPQIYLEVDRVKALRLGIPLDNVFQTLQAFLGSAYVNDFNLFGRSYRVIIQAGAEFRSKVGDIANLRVRAANGAMVPLGTLTRVSDSIGPQLITRYNLFPSATITGQPMPGVSSAEAVKVMEDLARGKLPTSMGYEWTGVTYQQNEAGDQAPFIFALALVFVFLFLAAQYESWAVPFAVILSVPFSVLGALALTWVRQFDNNVYTQIGLVLLIGLAAKSAIMIVEFAKQRAAEGLTLREAAIEASRLRFRPILMTAFSFILGVIPLLIASGAGAASRQSLGTVVFGGMCLGTFLALLLVPVLYVVIQGTALRFKSPQRTAVTAGPPLVGAEPSTSPAEVGDPGNGAAGETRGDAPDPKD